MPLSDDEERRLDEIERELAYGDPKFAATEVPDRDSQRPLMIATVLCTCQPVLCVAVPTLKHHPEMMTEVTVPAIWLIWMRLP